MRPSTITRPWPSSVPLSRVPYHPFSPIVGQLMAELIVDGQAQTLDITPLRLARFEENDPVKTPYSYGVMG